MSGVARARRRTRQAIKSKGTTYIISDTQHDLRAAFNLLVFGSRVRTSSFLSQIPQAQLALPGKALLAGVLASMHIHTVQY